LVFAFVSPESFAAGLEQIGNWQSEIGNVVAAQPHMRNEIQISNLICEISDLRSIYAKK